MKRPALTLSENFFQENCKKNSLFVIVFLQDEFQSSLLGFGYYVFYSMKVISSTVDYKLDVSFTSTSNYGCCNFITISWTSS
jgi:hypothetical protein